VIAPLFHRWEHRLASLSTNRVARPFEWGLEWLEDQSLPEGDPRLVLEDWGRAAVAASDAFYAVTPASDYALQADLLTFTSAIATPHVENNIVRARLFADRSARGRRRAVLVLPQWNADPEGHAGLCRLLNRFGITAPTTSSAPTLGVRRRCVVRPSWMRGARSGGCAPKDTSQSAFSAPVSDPASRC
jgi:hypothetical protein